MLLRKKERDLWLFKQVMESMALILVSMDYYQLAVNGKTKEVEEYDFLIYKFNLRKSLFNKL